MNYMENPYGGINTRYLLNQAQGPFASAQGLGNTLTEKKQEIKQGLAEEIKNFLEPYIVKAETQLNYATEQARYWGMLVSIVLIVLSLIGITLQGITLYNIKSFSKRLFEDTNVFSSVTQS